MKKIKLHSTNYLKAISQGLFFDNAYFGALFLLLILAFDSTLFLFGLISSVVGYAYSIRYSTPKILKDTGLIPVNGFFFGISMITLFHSSSNFYLFFILGCISIPLITKSAHEILQHWKLSPFIFPYIFMVWVISLCTHGTNLELNFQIWPSDPSTVSSLHPAFGFFQNFTVSLFQSIGRLLFLPDPSFGALLTVLVTLFSPRRGFYFLLGTLIATGAAFFLSPNSALWESGFFGYSAGIIGLGLASFPEKFKLSTILIFCGFSSILTMAMGKFLGRLELPILNLPYVFTLWISILSRTPKFHVSWAQPKLSQLRSIQGQAILMVEPIEEPKKVA